MEKIIKQLKSIATEENIERIKKESISINKDMDKIMMIDDQFSFIDLQNLMAIKEIINNDLEFLYEYKKETKVALKDIIKQKQILVPDNKVQDKEECNHKNEYNKYTLATSSYNSKLRCTKCGKIFNESELEKIADEIDSISETDNISKHI